MTRSRSALARHRKRKLQEATAHVSDAHDLDVVAEIAGSVSLEHLAKQLRLEAEARAFAHDAETVNLVIRVLRNVKNSVYHRAMAARALGLLMLGDPSLVAHLGLESEDLLDALLQLINCSRRFERQNADTRRVHVNCSLVISMLMRIAQYDPKPLQLVVNLDSELLAMPRRPTEPGSTFLLLTISGRPETVCNDPGAERVPLTSVITASKPPNRSFVSHSRNVPRSLNQQPPPSPRSLRKARDPLVDYTASVRTAEARNEEANLASIIERRQTPNRIFKMERSRVITPALVPAPRNEPTSRNSMPVILPSPHQRVSSVVGPRYVNNNQLDSTPRVATPSISPRYAPPTSNSLLNGESMVEIFRTGHMPVASNGYFQRHLRDDDAQKQMVTNRMEVVEWGEWRRREVSGKPISKGRADQINDPEIFESRKLSGCRDLAAPIAAKVKREHTATVDIHTPEYKRQRLHEILSSPIEPSEANTAHLHSLHYRERTATMVALVTELSELRDDEMRTRQRTRTRIDQERDKLPLKFLFQLPGGPAYCRNRMRTAMNLWITEFETNQKRMALLQWKAFVEQCRFRLRGQAYHRQAIEKRLKAAIEYVLRGYQQQAFKNWVAAVQVAIWYTRDSAARKIQREVRRFFTLVRFLRMHDDKPVGGCLRDVYLASPREAECVRFRIPQRVREERRRIWFSAELVQGMYRKRRFRRCLESYRVAASKIQAQARMRIQQARYRVVRKRVIKLQSWIRKNHHYRVYQALRQAAILVQTNFRSMRIKRTRQLVLRAQRRAVEWQLSSALIIQRAIRGYLGRCDAKRRRLDQDARFHAALTVQRAWYRRNNEWSTFLLLGCLREKEIEEIAFNKEILRFKRRYMAKRIQRFWRCHRDILWSQSVCLIQRNVRRWIATQFVQQMRQENIAHRRIKWFFRVRHAHRVRVACILQFWWLRSVPGRLAMHLRHRRLLVEAAARHYRYTREEQAATWIQSGARGRRDRLLARRERSARIIQKNARLYIVRQHNKREIRRLQALYVHYQTQSWIGAGLSIVLELRLGELNAAAMLIQRNLRGFLLRMWLMRLMVERELQERMARRIQAYWRQTAQARVARRVLIAQRRRRNNPFRAMNSISQVLKGTISQVRQVYDPDDELQGMHPAAWLKRLGLDEEKYMPLFEKNFSGDQNTIARLRASEDGESCLRLLARIGVDNDDDARHMVTNLFAKRTLMEVKQIRSMLDKLSRSLREDEKRAVFNQRQVHQSEQELSQAAEQLEEALNEAMDFRNPPKALRDKRERLTRRLEDAQIAHASMMHKNEVSQQRNGKKRRDILRLQDALSLREKDEVSAFYSLENFHLVHELNIARELFLRKFPGLEARALTFVGALEEGRVSTWQLLQFFQSNSTISQVKASMFRLTYFKYESDVKRYDSMRYQMGADCLFYGFERMCELLDIPVDEVAVETSPSTCATLTALVLTSTFQARKCRRPRDQVSKLTETLLALQKMDIVTTRVQSQWRRRAASRVMLILRSTRMKRQLREDYIAEVNADYVTPIWQEEREHEKQEYEQWLKDEAIAAREEKLLNILRYPWVEEWDAGLQTRVVFKVHPKNNGEDRCDYIYEGERPTYSLEEEDAVIRIQSFVRCHLSRLELYKRRRQLHRERERQEMEQAWQSRAAERAQAVTLRLLISTKANANVSLWIRYRRLQKQKTAGAKPLPTTNSPMSQIRGRRNAIERDDEEKIKLQNTEIARDFEAQLIMSGTLYNCEASYHRSVRSDHRRNLLFPGNARQPNCHAEVLHEFLSAAQQLERELAIVTETNTRLQYTRAALPFRWRELTVDARPYYFNSFTEETSWDRPQYSFEEENAAIKLQSIARVVLAQLEKTKMLADISFVETIHSTLQRAAKVGWIGYGVEGMSTSVFLSRLGLAKHIPLLASLSLDEVLGLSENRMKKLGWTKEDILTIRNSVPPRLLRRKFPLSSCLFAIPPTTKHPFNFLPSERVVHKIVSQSLPNQQGRVVGLVRAIKQSTTPISYRQLEIHLRLYSGRPDDAIAHISDIASLSYATQVHQENRILTMFLRCLEKCIVFAANLGLRALHEELTVALWVAAALLDSSGRRIESSECDPGSTTVECIDRPLSLLEAGLLTSPATPLARLEERDLGEEVLCAVTATRRRCVEQPVKGLWEHDCTSPTTSPLSSAQVALFLREHFMERVLYWWRSAAIIQSIFRMHRVRRWYCSVVAFRRHAALTIQCAWRSYCALEMKRLFESQQRSPYEQQFDKVTRTFFFVYKPTNEKLIDEPRDARGAILPFRPMIQDRVTKRWILAWPGLSGTSHVIKSDREGSEDWGLGAAPCSVCRVERAVRRCDECYSPAGDFVDFCLACFFDKHDSSGDLAWHTFSALQYQKTRAFHCVECKRFSTMRCLMCREHYCERCFHRVHHKGHTRARHTYEHYESMATVCVECEANVAFQRCLVCLDALCEDCMVRTHQRGNKRNHQLQLIKQTISAGQMYCEQCHVRRGDATCTFCAMLLCHPCLADPAKHGAACPETELQLKKKELLGDRLCVECGKPADRECESCGDKYCSVKWMGNSGCFERFHSKGKRVDHSCAPLTGVNTEIPVEILELEKKVKQKRRRDAEEAERVARTMAEALAATATETTTPGTGTRGAARNGKRHRKSVGTSKRRLLGTATSRLVCAVRSCGQPTLSAAVPFCANHLTSQHALEITKDDPLEAAKLLALIERHGGKFPVTLSGSFWRHQVVDRPSSPTKAESAPAPSVQIRKPRRNQMTRPEKVSAT